MIVIRFSTDRRQLSQAEILEYLSDIFNSVGHELAAANNIIPDWRDAYV